MLLSFVFFGSCVEDPLPAEQSAGQNLQSVSTFEYKLTIVSEDQLLKDLALSSLFEKKAAVKSTNNSLFEIQNNQAKVLEGDRFKTYVFHAGSDQTSFINYVLVRNKKTGAQKEFYMRYYPTADWVNRASDRMPFEGFVARYNSEGQFLNSTTGMEFPANGKHTSVSRRRDACPPIKTVAISIKVPCEDVKGSEESAGSSLPPVHICVKIIYRVIVPLCDDTGGGSSGFPEPPGPGASEPEEPGRSDGGGNEDASDAPIPIYPEVPGDLEDKVIEMFEGTDTDCVHDKMKENSQASLYNQLLTHFSDATGNWLVFEVGTTSKDNWGETSGSWLNSSNTGLPDTYTITISSSIDQNGSNLAQMVTLTHELIHAYMFDTLSDAGVILFDPNTGEPAFAEGIFTQWCGGDGTNYNGVDINSLELAERFEALICGMRQSGSLNSQWTHDIFNTTTFSVTTYQQQLADFLYNNHDWNSENPVLVLLLQNEFGSDWKEKAAEYMSWKGMESTQAFEDWANANNVDYTINSDGTIGGAFNAIISMMKDSGNTNCN